MTRQHHHLDFITKRDPQPRLVYLFRGQKRLACYLVRVASHVVVVTGVGGHQDELPVAVIHQIKNTVVASLA